MRNDAFAIADRIVQRIDGQFGGKPVSLEFLLRLGMQKVDTFRALRKGDGCCKLASHPRLVTFPAILTAK